MGKVFEWVRLGQGKRTLQVSCNLSGGQFTCDAIERGGDGNGIVIVRGEGKSGDTAIIQMSIALSMELTRQDKASA